MMIGANQCFLRVKRSRCARGTNSSPFGRFAFFNSVSFIPTKSTYAKALFPTTQKRPTIFLVFVTALHSDSAVRPTERRHSAAVG